MFSTVDHELHRMRRNALNPLFSMTAVRSLQPLIQERIDVVMRRMKEFINEDKVLNASYLFAAYTNGKIRSQPKHTKDRDAELT